MNATKLVPFLTRLACIALLTLALAACEAPDDPAGTGVLGSLEMALTADDPSLVRAVVSIQSLGQFSTEPITVEFALQPGTTSVAVAAVPVGLNRFSARVYDADGALRGVGETDAEVFAGQVAHVEIHVTIAQDEGATGQAMVAIRFNHPPVIRSVAVVPGKPEAGSTYEVRVDAVDPDGDALACLFAVTDGVISPRDACQADAMAPTQPGFVALTVTVGDGTLQATKKVVVEVQPVANHPAGQPDLTIRSASAAPIPVLPGETVTVTAVVRNQGSAPVSGAVLRACASSGWCADATIGPLDPVDEVTVRATLTAGPTHATQNPHFFDVVVDPDGAFAEVDESNNHFRPSKPAFVVELTDIAPLEEEEHDDVIRVVDGVILDATHVAYGTTGAPSVNATYEDLDKASPGMTNGTPEQPRIDPRVWQADADAQPGEMIEYIIKFAHDVTMPRLPDLSDKTNRFSTKNIPALTKRMAMFETVRRQRLAAADGLVALMQQAGGEVKEVYTLSGSMLVKAPKGLLATLDGHGGDVLHVETVHGGEQPPDSVADGRDDINSDPYYSAGATGAGFIALLDTGVRSSHTLFQAPDHLAFLEDCVNGDSYCNDDGDPSYDPDDLWGTSGHGTSTAAIITGNSNLGADTRGITAGWLDSWKVYGDTGLNTSAVHRAYDQAVLWGDKIIVAEMQSGQGPTGTIADDADDAFNAGSVTIAANGNNGNGGADTGSVNSPACAHKALGIGAYDVDSDAQYGNQSLGPTSDDRIKPDIQAPNNTRTASTTGNTATKVFTGTSGATPYGAGAASVFADWFGFTSASSTAQAGKIYAGLINAGPIDYWDNGSGFSNTTGVGHFALRTNGTLYTGSRNVTLFDNDYVTIDVPAGASRIAATIWWGEEPWQIHSDIDLYLEKPDGSTSDSSISVASVFEHLIVTAPITAGERRIRIYGYNVLPLTSQTVYYAISVQD